jgi:stage II sporulation protein D
MILLRADAQNLSSSLSKRKNNSRQQSSSKRLIRKSLPVGIFLSIIVLCFISCGKKEARVEPPHPPSTSPAQSSNSPGSTVPSDSSKARPEIIPLPDAVAEALAPPSTRLDSAKGSSLGPIVRIGLMTDAEEILLSSRGDYYLLENKPETSKQLVRGKIQIQVESEGETAKNASCFRIQVASLQNPESAEALREQLAETYDVKVTISNNTEATLNRVRVGEYQTREEAGGMQDILKRSGYPDAFMVEDVLLIQTGKPALALRGTNSLFHVNNSGFLFLPSSDKDLLSINGKAYRGLLDIRLNSRNRITVVNQLRLEEYLRGVVPAELSPSKYPEFAAQAAQSIAARTYALKHLGRYHSQGFDLTDDTRTQVYRGVSIEKRASDDAVQQTAGLAIYYENVLIDAMYTSTCGGRTEDFSNVFDAPPVPYLKSVFCTIEGNPQEGLTRIAGNHRLKVPVLADDGSLANRNLEFARILGIIDGEKEFSPEFLDGAITKNEAADWVENTLTVIQKHREKPDTVSIETRIGFLNYAAESIFGPDEILRKISPRDATYYLDNLKDGDTVPNNAHASLAYLMQKALWHPFSDNTVRPADPMRRSEAIFLLIRWIESIQPEILYHGVLTGTDSSNTASDPVSELQIQWGDRTQKYSISDTLPIFRMEAGRKIPVDSMKIIGNENTNFHFGPHKNIDFLEVELNSEGAANDRYSPAATWEVTLSRPDVAEKLRSLAGNIGTFRDMQPSRLGNSGRVVQIQVIGSRSSVVLNGYKARSALGLQDTLFTLTRRQNPDGTIAEFTFHGRGFGHGIGLCQVGAAGMAKAGKSYEEILKTYYQGVEIGKAY